MFYKKFTHLFQDVVLVGVGGTGSRVVGPLIQTLKQATRKIEPVLHVCDGDIFEAKNLSRQNCIEPDLGRNKAVVMAERYGAALNFPVVPCVNYFTNSNFLQELSSSRYNNGVQSNIRTSNMLIILCVDNVDARINILSQAPHDAVIIDCGNEDTFGQVSIFNNISIGHLPRPEGYEFEKINPFVGEFSLPFVPAPVESYLNAVANPSPATGSCADLDQSLAINNLMAAGVINKVQNLVYDNKFYSRTDYYDLIQGNSSEKMSVPWFNQEFSSVTKYTNVPITNVSSRFLTGLSDLRLGYEELYETIVNTIKEETQEIDPAILAAIK